jgi:hypothetical protein
MMEFITPPGQGLKTQTIREALVSGDYKRSVTLTDLVKGAYITELVTDRGVVTGTIVFIPSVPAHSAVKGVF